MIIHESQTRLSFVLGRPLTIFSVCCQRVMLQPSPWWLCVLHLFIYAICLVFERRVCYMVCFVGFGCCAVLWWNIILPNIRADAYKHTEKSSRTDSHRVCWGHKVVRFAGIDHPFCARMSLRCQRIYVYALCWPRFCHYITVRVMVIVETLGGT